MKTKYVNSEVPINKLVAQFQNQDVEAFEELYQMYSESIYGAIRYIVKDEKDAQDLCQEVFIKIWNNTENYDYTKGRFFTWILNIARNSAIDHVRSRTYKNKSLTTSSENYNLSNVNTVNKKQQTEEVHYLLKNLKEKNRQVIVLFFLKGFSQKQISKKLNISVRAVKNRSRHALLKLRKRFNTSPT